MQQETAAAQIRAGLGQRRAWLMLLAVVQLWFVANGSALLGRQFQTATAMFYLFFMFIPLALDHELLESLLKGSLSEYALKFTVGFVAGWASTLLIFSVLLRAPPTPIAFSAVYPTIALQLLFVAPAEELFFRGYVPRIYDPAGKSWKMLAGVSSMNALWTASLTLSDVATSATFSAFHYAAYGGNAWIAFAVAFGLSVAFLLLSKKVVEWPFHEKGDKRPMGIALTIGWHFAFNMCALGIFTGGVLFDA